MIDLINVVMDYNSKKGKTDKARKSASGDEKRYPALNGINLHIDDGEFVFIVGQSGSGKSTLIRLLLKELEPTSGTIMIGNKDIRKIKHRDVPKYRRGIGVIFQDFRLLQDRTCAENIEFARMIAQGSGRRKDVMTPADALYKVGMHNKAKSYPNELSGGEQQRIAIARAIINKPRILLCDEPTGNLDLENTLTVMRELESINKTGTTVIVVTHNIEIVQQFRKRTITMSNGKIISDIEKGGINYEYD